MRAATGLGFTLSGAGVQGSGLGFKFGLGSLKGCVWTAPVWCVTLPVRLESLPK